MKFYFENSHCTPVLGGLMLDAIFGGQDPNGFGIRLEQSNLKAHLARILEDRAVYARTNAADIQWVQRVMADAEASRK
jgi:hypothetical protein